MESGIGTVVQKTVRVKDQILESPEIVPEDRYFVFSHGLRSYGRRAPLIEGTIKGLRAKMTPDKRRV